MEHKAVIDTNVVVSALINRGKRSPVTDVMTMLSDGTLQPIASDDIFKEYESVLTRPRFDFSPERIKTVLDFFRQNAIIADTWDTGVELPDPSDLPFFEAYIAEQSPETFLVTGNKKHYPDWPYIVTPREIVGYLA